jgi:NinB protein
MLNQKQSLKIPCPTCGQSPRRSLPQNSRLHKLFQLMSEHFKGKDGLYHPHQWWKVMCKYKWLGYNEYVGANGTIYALKSTADCDVEELNNFMNEVERFCAERGVYLQD